MTQTTRFVTFLKDGAERYGAVVGDGVVDLSARYANEFPTLREVIAAGAMGRLADAAAGANADLALKDAVLRPPIPAPEKIICIGVNYPDRNEEYKDGQAAPKFPSMFLRVPRSFVGHGAPLVRPRASEQLDYEGELVLVIGKAGRHIPEKDALDHVAAVSLCNEGTLRDWVRHAKFNVTQGKNFDATGSIGPWIETDVDLTRPLHVTVRKNGTVTQDDTTANMIFSFADLIAYVTTFMTLKPGDIISTGTPVKHGSKDEPPVWLKPGDTIEIECPEIGVLRNGVMDEA